jgi:hypothetical protein
LGGTSTTVQVTEAVISEIKKRHLNSKVQTAI